MGKYLDLHDVAYGNPLAEEELQFLRLNVSAAIELLERWHSGKQGAEIKLETAQFIKQYRESTFIPF